MLACNIASSPGVSSDNSTASGIMHFRAPWPSGTKNGKSPSTAGSSHSNVTLPSSSIAWSCAVNLLQFVSSGWCPKYIGTSVLCDDQNAAPWWVDSTYLCSTERLTRLVVAIPAAILLRLSRLFAQSTAGSSCAESALMMGLPTSLLAAWVPSPDPSEAPFRVARASGLDMLVKYQSIALDARRLKSNQLSVLCRLHPACLPATDLPRS